MHRAGQLLPKGGQGASTRALSCMIGVAQQRHPLAGPHGTDGSMLRRRRAAWRRRLGGGTWAPVRGGRGAWVPPHESRATRAAGAWMCCHPHKHGRSRVARSTRARGGALQLALGRPRQVFWPTASIATEVFRQSLECFLGHCRGTYGHEYSHVGTGTLSNPLSLWPARRTGRQLPSA